MRISGPGIFTLAIALLGAPLACTSEGEDSETDTDTDTDTDSDADTDSDTDADQTTLELVMERGELQCGISGSAVGFSLSEGGSTAPEGFDVDFCRAVAAAVFGDDTKVDYVELNAAERFDAVANGDVDVLFRTTTWTQSRDALLGVDFGPTTFYDGQQFMGRASDGYSSSSAADAIAGATVCVVAGTTNWLNVIDLTADLGLEITLETYEDPGVMIEDYIAGSCDLVTTDGSALAGMKAAREPTDQDWRIFPPTPISKEPLGPVYREGDAQWAGIVDWTVFAMILFDEKGITRANAAAMKADPQDAEAERLLGGQDELQTALGLGAEAFYDVVRLVGNYDDVFADNLTPLGMTRAGSPNASWQDGGILYAPPAR